MVYLPIDHEEQHRRVTNRFATTPRQTFRMSEVELEQWRMWAEWASQRWPSLPDQYATTVD